MRFRTLALALALVCGLTAVGEAKQKPAVRRPAKTAKGPKFTKTKPGKVKRFKGNQYKPSKRSVKRAKR